MKGAVKLLKNRSPAVKSLASGLAANGGLYLLFSAADPTGVLGTVQAVKLFGELAGAIADLAKQAQAEREKDTNPEEALQKLFKLLTLESYAFAISTKLSEFPVGFRRRLKKDFGAGADLSALAPCDLFSQQTLPQLARPTLEVLDTQLLLVLDDQGDLTDRCHLFVQSVRTETERQIALLAVVRPHYQPLVQLATYYGATGGQRGSSQARPSEVPVIAPDQGGTPTQPSQLTASSPTFVKSVTAPAPQLVGKLRERFEQRFSEARREVDQGSCERGEKLFTEIIGDVASLAEDGFSDLLARACYNRGVALVNLRREQNAIEWFERASTITPGAERVPLAKFFLARCRQDYPAVRRELAELGGEIDVVNQKAFEAEAWLREGNAIKALEVTANLESSNVASLRIHAFCALAQFDQAIGVADTALARWPDDVQLRVSAAYAYARPIVTALQDQRGVRRIVSERERAVLQRALGFYRAVEKEAKEHGLFQILYDALSWTSLIHLALDELPEALKANDQAIGLFPRDADVLINRHTLLIKLDRFTECEAVARKISTLRGFEVEGDVRLVASLLGGSKVPEAELEMARLLAAHPELKVSDFRVANHLLHIAQMKGDDATLLSLTDHYLGMEGASFMILTTAAEALEARGLSIKADDALARADALAPTAQKNFVRAAAASILFHREDWAGAIARFADNGVDPLETHYSEEILWCLYRLGDHGGTLQLAKRLESASLLTSNSRRAYAGVCVDTLDLAGAERQLAEIVKASRNRGTDFLNLFLVRRQIRPFDECWPVLVQGRDAHPDDPRLRAALTRAYAVIGKYQESVAEARALTKLSPGTPLEEDNWATFVLGNVPPGLLTSEELKKIADIAERRSTKAALQGPDGSIHTSEFAVSVEEQTKYVETFAELSRTHHFSGSFAARAMDVSVWEFWWRNTQYPSGNVWMARGSLKELESEREICTNSSTVVMDYSVLCTFAFLARLPLLTQLFGKVIVIGPTRAVFLAELEQVKAIRPATMTAAYKDGKLLFTTIPTAWFDRKRQLLGDVIAFFSAPEIGDAAPSSEELAAHAAIIDGESALDGGTGPAILAAKTLSLPFVSDEEVVRNSVCPTVGVTSFCTQAILTLALERGFLTESDHSAILRSLIEANYWFVSVPPEFLRSDLRAKKYRHDRVTEKLVRSIPTSTFGGIPNHLELGRVVGDLWLHRDEPGAWAPRDWMQVLAEPLDAKPADRYLFFCLGICRELTLFPSVAHQLVEAIINELKPKSRTEKLLRASFALARRIMAGANAAGPAVNATWRIFRYETPVDMSEGEPGAGQGAQKGANRASHF